MKPVSDKARDAVARLGMQQCTECGEVLGPDAVRPPEVFIRSSAGACASAAYFDGVTEVRLADPPFAFCGDPCRSAWQKRWVDAQLSRAKADR